MRKLSEKFTRIGRRLRERGMDGNPQRGAIDIGGVLLMGIGMIFLAVGFIMFPIVTEASDDLIAWHCAANATWGIEEFTGFEPIIGITPLLVLVGYLSAAVFSMYLGVRMVKGGGSTSLDLGSILMLGISMIFIAIGLIILPVVLDAICSLLTGADILDFSDYTGLQPILEVTPLLVLIAFITGAVVTGFFGLKRIGK